MQGEVDNRTFPEIWNDLSPMEKRKMIKAFVIADIIVDRHMLWLWGSGRQSPTQTLVRKAVEYVMNNELGYNVSHETLFP